MSFQKQLEHERRRKGWRRHIRPALGALVIVGAASLAFVDARPTSTSANTDPIDLSFVDGSGTDGSLASLRGKPVLVHIWATYCPPCRVELPSLLDYGASGEVQTVLISVDSGWTTIERFFAGAPPSSVVIADPSEVSKSLGVSSLPETFLLDREGRIVEHFRGPYDWHEPGTRERIRLALAER